MRHVTKISLIALLFWLLAGTVYYGDQGWIRENGVKDDYSYDVRFDLPDQQMGRQFVVQSEDHDGDVMKMKYVLDSSRKDGDITYYILQKVGDRQTFELIVDTRDNLLTLLSHETSQYTFRDTIQWHLSLLK